MNESSVYWFGGCTVYLFDRHSYSRFFCSWFLIFAFFLNPLIFIFVSYIFCLLIFFFAVLIPKILHYLYLQLSEVAVQKCFLEKSALKISSKFAGEHACRSMISLKLVWNFIEIALQHGCSPVNLLHIFRTPFPRNFSAPDLISC